MLLCSKQFKLVQQSRKQALRAYCPNIYTVYGLKECVKSWMEFANWGRKKNRQKNFFLSRSKTQIMWPQIEPKRREVKNDRLSDSNHFIRCLNGFFFYNFSHKISSTNWQLGSLQWKYITVKKVNLDYKLADSIMYKSILYLNISDLLIPPWERIFLKLMKNG